MDITFLEADVPLTKTYSRDAAGVVTKTPYPFVWEFTSHAATFNTLDDLKTLLTRHAARGHCMLKGQVNRPLVRESRAGSTDSTAPTSIVILDLDGLPETFMLADSAGIEHKVAVTLTTFLDTLGLGDISYIVQWSASHGIENSKLRAHVFFLLDKPLAAPLLKQWLIQLNHQTAMLVSAMQLTKTGNAISWALDISACQNDKLIYIAPPVLKGIKDPMGKNPRIALVKKKHDRLSIAATINSHAKNKELTSKRLDELRDAASLPKRKTTFKMHGSVEVMVRPDSCVVSEMKQERGFVYFNLNGGDSWAYYHPESNPDYIFNFKGEPAYLTKELLPDYWEQLTKAGARANSAGQTFLAFCDRSTGAYWRGSFDAATDVLSLHVAKNETQIRHFAKQHGLPLGDFIPEWDLTFNPHDSVRVDFTNKTVNRFELTPYMKAQARQVTQCPKTILRVIDHVLGNDPACVAHFMNWIAYVLQFRDRSKTSWVWHGVPGTGKGILFNKILRPIFGKSQTAAQNMQTLAEPYNGYMAQSLLIFIDEVQTKALINEKGVSAKLRNYVTEEMVPIREMFHAAREVRNYANWIFSSNMPDPVVIEKNDRRTNVAKYQATPLVVTDKEMAAIEKELQAFHDYLLYFPVDKVQAGTVLDTTDRQTMIEISESSVDTVSNAIIDGRFGFLMEQLPSTTTNVAANQLLYNQTEDYRAVLKALLQRTDRNNGNCSIARDELRTIYGYVVGGMPATPNKFTSLLKHHRVHMSDVWINTGTSAGKERGIKTYWTDLAQWQDYLDVFDPPAAKAPKAKPVATKKGKAKLAVV